MPEDQQDGSILKSLAFADVKGTSNLVTAKELKAEHNLLQRVEQLTTIQEELLSSLVSLNGEGLSDEQQRIALFRGFSGRISEFFPEIKQYETEGQIASEFSPKSVEVEHKKTVASMYYLLTLTADKAPIQDANDVRFKALVPVSFHNKFSSQFLEEQRQIINTFLDDKSKLYLMTSMLAIHDMAKLGTIAQIIEKIRQTNGQPHTTDHDIAFQSLLNSEKHVSRLVPTLDALPTDKQNLIKSVLRAGSEVNIGQIGQGLEGNPSQLEAISKVELTDNEIGFWFMENLCDTASAAGTPDGSALIMSQENVWKAWKWSVSSLQEVKSGKAIPVNAYLDLLQNKADELGTSFDRSQDTDITALRICMALQTTNPETYQQIHKFLDEKGQHLIHVFGMTGMVGEPSYRLYYSPSILRKISQMSGLPKALEFMDKTAGLCEEKVSQESIDKGEVTFQLSPIDALINTKMQPEQLQEILDGELAIDNQLYVKLMRGNSI